MTGSTRAVLGLRLRLADVEPRASASWIASRAVIHGWHRSLCMYSYMYRGTPDRPGLVLGLDRGGHCQGVAFAVAAADWNETLDYLRAREQVTNMYREMRGRCGCGRARRPGALLCGRPHAHQYAGRLNLREHACTMSARDTGNQAPAATT